MPRPAASDLNYPYIRCFLLNANNHLTPQASFEISVLAGVPFPSPSALMPALFIGGLSGSAELWYVIDTDHAF